MKRMAEITNCDIQLIGESVTSLERALSHSALIAASEQRAVPAHGGTGRARLLADVAWRLGPRACALFAWHRLRLRAGSVARALRPPAMVEGPLLPDAAPPASLPGDAAALAAAAAAIPRDWHGGFAAGIAAPGLDLLAAGDIRPVWERNRLLALPLLAMAARLAPAEGHLAAAEALLAAWRRANPPFRGPAWACGQEAALRAMHLCLALALLDAAPGPAMRGLLAAHARRIAATRAYAAAQDNNHALSEAAGLFVIGLVLGDRALARGAGRGLARGVARLVLPCGAFAQASPGYHRLLLDTLAIAEWFRRRHGAPPFAAPFAARAAAATLWLHRVLEPATGALPRCGAMDDSAFADLSLCGPHDARGSVERAARLFCGAGADAPEDAGCAWLGLAQYPEARDAPEASPEGTATHAPDPERSALVARLPRGGAWRSAGWLGEERDGLRVLLRTGAGLGFRPAQCDLLHAEFWADGAPLLMDGGTGAYNPSPGDAWLMAALWDTAAHNTIQFDGEEQMPRLGRFLLARWPRCAALADGARLTDARGRVQERRLRLLGRSLVVEDTVRGAFADLALRWRLGPGAWRAAPHGAEGPRGRIRVEADAPLRLRLDQGWHSPAYGVTEPALVLEARAAAPVSRLVSVMAVA